MTQTISNQPITAVPKVIIDRRPMWLILMSRFRPLLFVAALFAAFFFALQLDPPSGLNIAAWRTLCLFGLTVSLWISGIVPLAITSLLCIALIPLLGILNASQAYAYFGNKAVFFILGAFILGAAIVGCGLSTRMTIIALRRFGKTPRKLVLTVYLFTAIASCLMSEHAVAAMTFPIVWQITHALKLRRGHSVYGKSLYFALAWGCIIGGTTTILGGARGPLAIGILEEITKGQYTISFLQYVIYDLPLVILLMFFGWLILRFGYPPEIKSVDVAIEELETKIHAMGKWSLSERLVLIIMALTILTWIFAGEKLGLANIAIISAAAMFMFNLITWKDVEENVNWGVLLMFGGAITLGGAMSDTKAALWITQSIFGDWQGSAQTLMLMLGVVSLVLTEFMSNSAVIAILMPPALTLAKDYGIDPRLMTMAIVLPSNFAFMMPMATPATAMAYSSGFFTMREAMTAGMKFNLAGFVALLFLIYVYWPLFGQM